MLIHFIFLVKEDELEKRSWEFEYVKKMAQFYKQWIEKTFSKKVDVLSDQMVVKPGHSFNLINVPALLDDHRKRGEDIFHFYLAYFRPLWTDCTCEGYFAENFGMVWWEKNDKKDDVSFLMEKNCVKVSHELAHEFLRQSGYKNYKELVHEVWDKHLFASLYFEYYDENFVKTTKNPIFAVIDASAFRL
jgi:hypothetical protein